MSEFKGTKGKWGVDGDGVYSLDPLVLDNIVCLHPEATFDSHKNWKANALLISKAPEMLEMLKYLNMRGGLGLDIHDKLKQLIKEATEL